MGCDIHLYVEKKVKGNWICINPMIFSHWGDYKTRKLGSVFDDRNYELFGFLAQVRGTNENGFEAKGFPVNASPTVKSEYKDWDGNSHSANSLTLEELHDKLKGTVKVSGMMEKHQLLALKQSITRCLATGAKPNWALLYPYCENTTDKSHTKFTIPVPMLILFERFRLKVIDFMEEHADFSDTGIPPNRLSTDSSVRIVFWFDN